MVMRILTLMLTLAFSCSANALQSTEEGEWSNNYVGDIDNKYKIEMTLIYRNDEVHGSYFYNKYLRDIGLSGKVLNRNQIRLEEHNEQGEAVAVFEGHFIEYRNKDPRKSYGNSTGKLDKEVIVGTWQKVGHEKKMPFYLALDNATYRSKGEGRYAAAGVEDDSVIEQSAQAFWQAVKSGDKMEVSKLISYPIYVNFSGKRHEIKDENEFLKNYDKVFTKAFKKKIEQGVPHNMFVKYCGVMLGNGEIWFGSDGKIIAINN